MTDHRSNRFGLSKAALLFAAPVLAVGCNVIFGTNDIDYSGLGAAGGATTTTSVGAGGTGGVGGSSTSATVGGGGVAACEEGESMACYSGPADTRSVGACQDGVSTCDATGNWGPCVGEVVPAVEDCYTQTDEACDGVPRCLDGDGLVVRYFIDEAADGTAPTELLDSGPAPAANLTGSYVGTMAFTEENGSRALEWAAAGEDGIFVGPAPAKAITALDGSLSATIEVVARIEGTEFSGSRMFFFGQGATGGNLSLLAKADRFEFRSNTYTVIKSFMVAPAATWSVYHLVVDRAAAAADRHRLYINGLRVDTVVEIGDDQPLAFAAGDSIGVGNRDVLLRSLQGAIGYAAVYSEAFPVARVELHRDLLSVSHDQSNTPHQSP